MGGIPELVREGETGLIFEAGNADDLERKLRYLLETPDVLNRYTAHCKSVTFETPETYYQQIRKIYGE
jgi:glycosyltransferase involved in cell wall biosynthesis